MHRVQGVNEYTYRIVWAAFQHSEDETSKCSFSAHGVSLTLTANGAQHGCLAPGKVMWHVHRQHHCGHEDADLHGSVTL